MSKIIDSTTITGPVSKMLETPDNFIINSQVYNKETLEPIKLNTLYVASTDVDIIMNIYAKSNSNNNLDYYSTNTVLTDKYDPKYSYTMNIDRQGYFKIAKFMTNEDESITLQNEYSRGLNFTYFTIYSQDVNYIYGVYTNDSFNNVIFRINKKTLLIDLTSINGSYSRITLLKDTPLYIYYSYSTAADNFYIGKYNKSNNSKSDIYNDNGTVVDGFNSFFRPMLSSDNEIISLRTNKSFNNLGIDNIILKRYIIDYDYEKIYSRNIELDCSLVPKGMIQRINSTSNFTECFYFEKNDKQYFSFWNKADKMLYLASKTSENLYSIIQVYELANSYYGVIPYNNGETLIFYNPTSTDFLSFRDLEERYELSTALRGNYKSIGIDKNNTIWVQDENNSVEMIGLNVPTIAEAVFVDQQLDYKNNDIETFIEVFCKNFSGSLIETTVEIFLTGPIYFSDTKIKKKKIKTSANNTIRVPVTITNSGLVETNVKIL